jgi:asparagine synthase (glutamine-hydrolysing)
MTDVVAYRGPDGIKHLVAENMGVAHLQLCTTAESQREQQPLCSNDGNYVITCDGRVDNRKDLMAELSSLVSIGTHSTDAELILEAYLAWGDQCVRRIVGDFAFAIWDTVRQKLFCARDPLGIRQFHYHYDGRRFIFGTEIKQVLEHPNVPRELDPLTLGIFLRTQPDDGEMTMYRRVRRLRGGCTLNVSRGGLSIEKYWNPQPENRLRMKDEEFVEEFLPIFKKAVACRLRCHRPVGMMLSGGMDSSSIACIAGELGRERRDDPQVHAFSWDFDENRTPDPPEYIRGIQRKYGFPLTWIDGRNFWALQDPAMSWGWDEPFNPPYEAQWQRTFKSINDRGMTVALTGLGGDELLSYYYLPHMREWLRGFNLRNLFAELRALNGPARKNAIKLLCPALVPEWLQNAHYKSRPRRPRWLRPEFYGWSGLTDWENTRSTSPAYPSNAARVIRQALEPGMPIGVVSLDQVSARYSMELRHPFWDRRVVDFLVRLPPEQKWRNGVTKSLLRRAMAGIVPEPVLDRRVRSSFLPFLRAGVQGPQAEPLERLMERPALEALGVIDAGVLREDFHRCLRSNGRQLQAVFRTLTAEKWIRQSFPDLPTSGWH